MPTPTKVAAIVPPGYDGAVYANSGTHGSPSWNLIDNIMDVDLGDKIDEFELCIRRNAPMKTFVNTLREWNPQFGVAWIPTDTLIIALLDASLNGTGLDLIFLDGLIGVSGTQGPRADFKVEGVPRSEKLKEGMNVQISLKPLLTANKPVWFVAP